MERGLQLGHALSVSVFLTQSTVLCGESLFLRIHSGNCPGPFKHQGPWCLAVTAPQGTVRKGREGPACTLDSTGSFFSFSCFCLTTGRGSVCLAQKAGSCHCCELCPGPVCTVRAATCTRGAVILKFPSEFPKGNAIYKPRAWGHLWEGGNLWCLAQS